jgi:hypothetical protein
MTPQQSLALLKAMADGSRLAILHSLLKRPQYVEEIAQCHDLAASTVSFHLGKLERSGLVTSHKEQYYAVFRANDDALATTLREIVAAHPVGQELQDDRMAEYRRKVLGSFFRDGRLEKLPAQHKKRLIVLEQFAARFEAGRRYNEPEVTGLVAPLFDDHCTIRRLLVDAGLIRRQDGTYWRDGQPGDAAPPPPQPRETSMTQPATKAARATARRLYKQTRPDVGIYQLRNTANGRIYVGSAENLEAARTSRLFQLNMGKVVFSREMQRDLDEFGAGSFEFSVLEILDAAVPEADCRRKLAALHLRWLDRLQPFGDRGYNSLKAFQRETNRLGPPGGVTPAG